MSQKALERIQEAKKKGLKRLDLSRGELVEIPKEVFELSQLTNLTSVDLYNNKITDISPLRLLISLTALDLSENKFTDISSLQSLTNLATLVLSNNQITNIRPPQSLINLDTLYLENNQVTNIEPLLAIIKKGLPIWVDGNPLTVPPLEVVQQGNEPSIRYF
jgi:internalin A